MMKRSHNIITIGNNIQEVKLMNMHPYMEFCLNSARKEQLSTVIFFGICGTILFS